MSKFRKKPVVIEAVQWRGNNLTEILHFMKEKSEEVYTGSADKSLLIPTLEGNHRADISDWIIKGVKGEFYLCKPDIFEQTYELEEEK